MGGRPNNVVRAVKHDCEQAFFLATADELVSHLAGHRGKPAGPQRGSGVASHLHLEPAADHDNLFHGGMVVPRDDTPGRRFQKDSGGASRRITRFEYVGEALDVVIRLKLRGIERLQSALRR